MRKIIMVITVSGLLVLTGCSEEMSEEELVHGKEPYGAEEVAEDLQASSFPFSQHFYTLPELKDKVQDLLGDAYWPEIDLSAKELENLTGIESDMYVDFLAERQVMDAHIDTLIVIHAKEDHVGEIERAIETYRNGIIEENRNHPQNLGKAQASRMETIDDYICFVQLGADTTPYADKGTEAVAQHCLEENERALYVLEQAILQQ
ncbi:MAG: DUF4358 domain-containing protein [Bacteroidales bacterium]|nr:DUF4358 domain-containing protein [Bacteroidales bacterium]MCM1415181.1 DUF4358 domain-containing protein [bacterium]MCM1423359.1 DUF4358 domain-containing protein [bacterium]